MKEDESKLIDEVGGEGRGRGRGGVKLKASRYGLKEEL